MDKGIAMVERFFEDKLSTSGQKLFDSCITGFYNFVCMAVQAHLFSMVSRTTSTVSRKMELCLSQIQGAN
jgi:hypothetical protein